MSSQGACRVKLCRRGGSRLRGHRRRRSCGRSIPTDASSPWRGSAGSFAIGWPPGMTGAKASGVSSKSLSAVPEPWAPARWLLLSSACLHQPGTTGLGGRRPRGPTSCTTCARLFASTELPSKMPPRTARGRGTSWCRLSSDRTRCVQSCERVRLRPRGSGPSHSLQPGTRCLLHEGGRAQQAYPRKAARGLVRA